MQTWRLAEIETPGGSRSPVVLRSEDEARAVLVGLDPGQELGDHQVKEHAWIVVVGGSATFRAGDEEIEAPAGTLARFEPDERHSVGTERARSCYPARPLAGPGPLPGPGEGSGDRLGPARRAGPWSARSDARACGRRSVDDVAQRHEEREQEQDVQDQPGDGQVRRRDVDEDARSGAEDRRTARTREGRLRDRAAAAVDRAGGTLPGLPFLATLGLGRASTTSSPSSVSRTYSYS